MVTLFQSLGKRRDSAGLRETLLQALSGLACKDVSEAARGRLWDGSSLSLLMNHAGPDLATISQLSHTVQNPLLMKGEQMSSQKSAAAARWEATGRKQSLKAHVH